MMETANSELNISRIRNEMHTIILGKRLCIQKMQRRNSVTGKFVNMENFPVFLQGVKNIGVLDISALQQVRV